MPSWFPTNIESNPARLKNLHDTYISYIIQAHEKLLNICQLRASGSKQQRRPGAKALSAELSTVPLHPYAQCVTRTTGACAKHLHQISENCENAVKYFDLYIMVMF